MEGHKWKCVLVLSFILSTSSAADRQPDLESGEQANAKPNQRQSPLFRHQVQQGPQRQYYATTPPQQYQQQAPPNQGPPQASTGPHQFTPEARQFPPAPPIQVQFPSRAPQQQVVQFPLYPQQGHEQQFQFQYIPDNSLNQDLYNIFSSPTTPQYVYVQQPHTPIPVNNKQGGIDYIQYIDQNTNILTNPRTQATFGNHNHKASHNLAGLIQRTAHTNVLPLNYRQPAPQTYRVQGMPQPLLPQNVYVIPPPPAQQPIQQTHELYQQPESNQVLSQQRYLLPAPQNQGIYQQPQQIYQPQQSNQVPQQRFLHPGIVYAQPNEQQSQQSISNVVYEKREPQSLLESYIPSYLQVEYYKQLEKQQQGNGIQDTRKTVDLKQ